MVNENKLKTAFTGVKRDIATLNYELQNRARYWEYVATEQKVRLQEIERRLAQLERLAIRETLRR